MGALKWYESISITGGNLYLIPGIYVIAPKSVKQNPLKLTGGLVIAEGVMFYNTGSSYSPGDGTPDINDYKKSATKPAASNETNSHDSITTKHVNACHEPGKNKNASSDSKTITVMRLEDFPPAFSAFPQVRCALTCTLTKNRTLHHDCRLQLRPRFDVSMLLRSLESGV